MPLLHILQRLKQLDAKHRAWLCVFVVALPLIRLCLHLRGYARTRAFFDSITAVAPSRHPARNDIETAEQLARIAQVAGRRGFLPATCLPQAIAVYAALRRRGLDPVLQIGVRKANSQFEAHAWVELSGHPLAQPALDHQPLPLPQRTSSLLQPDSVKAP